MHCHLKKLAIVAAFAIGGAGAAYTQNAVEQLQPLVETTAHRLMIGEQVALAKWDSGKAVEDAPREAQVIRDAMKGASGIPRPLSGCAPVGC
jgi:chorismate mutase